MALCLIVKGNRYQAARAAADRGIPFAFVRETNNETVGLTAEIKFTEVSQWFGEAPSHAPFPIGTLLLYTEQND